MRTTNECGGVRQSLSTQNLDSSVIYVPVKTELRPRQSQGQIRYPYSSTSTVCRSCFTLITTPTKVNPVTLI
eukprot:1472954-Rhodomonas_salina.3